MKFYPAGTIFTLHNRTYKSVPNLIQILLQKESCGGGAFEVDAGCDGFRCGSRFSPIDQQVIAIRADENVLLTQLPIPLSNMLETPEAQMSHKFKDTPEPGTVLTLEDGTRIKIIPNLAQIINRKDTCAGCYFEPRLDGKCGLHRTNNVPTGKWCACHNIDPKYQVIYVKEKS